jgi:trans-aconitate methyltransferase
MCMLDQIPYTDTFFTELNPHILRCIAALRGFDVPDSMSFTYCELGCGNGHSLIVYAAANPQATFIGIDFNRDHIDHANKRAASLGISNCRFIQADITNLEQLPTCDYIVMHGLYAWVHQSVRNAIHGIIKKSLSSNGLALISYNAYPGWHVYEPLRMMMREYSMGLSDDPFYNAEQGIGFLEWMLERNPEYVKAVPSAASFIKELSRHDIKYIIHEYYADNWTPLSFSDMEHNMSEIGLTFVGQIPLYLNNGAICLPEGFDDFLALEEEVSRFEVFKDLIRNTMFRWDVYAKNEPQDFQGFQNLHLGIVQMETNLEDRITLPGCSPVDLDSAYHEPIMQALNDRHMHVKSILAYAEEKGISMEHARNALLNLLYTEHIKPIPDSIHSEASRMAFKQILARFLEEALISNVHVIPSSFSGSGIHINQDTALMLIAITKHTDNPIEWIAEWMEIQGYGDYVDVIDKARTAYHQFIHTLPFWKRMNIV